MDNHAVSLFLKLHEVTSQFEAYSGIEIEIYKYMKLLNLKSNGFAVILIILISVSTLYSDEQPKGVVKPKYNFSNCEKIDNQNFLVENNIPCEILNNFSLLAEDVLKLSVRETKLKRVIFSKGSSLFQSVSYDNLIDLSEGGRNINDAPKFQKIIWVHEIGHVIFNEMLNQDYRDHQVLANMSKINSDKIWDEKKITYDPTLELSENKLSKFIGGYHELFADFVTAIYENDLDATYSSFDNGNIQNDTMIRLSFKNVNQDGTCEEWQHFYFSFARPVIAQKFLVNIKTFSEKKLAIANFYNFLSKDLFEKYTTLEKPLNCEIANKKLIEKLNNL